MSPATIVLAAEPPAARAARVFVRENCGAVRDPDMVEDAQLLVTELVANAVRHGDGPIEVDVTCAPGDGIEIRVRDSAAGLPEPREAAPDHEGGRGLTLVAALSDSWGVDRHAPGKTVWFQLRCA